MKKYLLALLLISTNAFASSGKVETIFDAQAVAGTGPTITSRTFNTKSAGRMGFWLKAAKAATPEGVSLAMDIEGSYSDTSSTFATMATVMALYQFPTTSTVIASASTITVQSMPYVRFVIRSLTGNATGTTVTAKLFTQEYN